MTNIPTEFDWYDAWILAALIYAQEESAPVPLWRLIATADALGKLIVFREELEVALARLDRAGYVRVVPDGFEATAKALALKAPGAPVLIVERAIGSKPWSQHAQVPKTSEEIYVSAEAHAAALKKYRKEFRRMYRDAPDA